MENLEELNARFVEDVNNGEQECAMRDMHGSVKEIERIRNKTIYTEETIQAMKKRLIEMRA